MLRYWNFELKTTWPSLEVATSRFIIYAGRNASVILVCLYFLFGGKILSKHWQLAAQHVSLLMTCWLMVFSQLNKEYCR